MRFDSLNAPSVLFSTYMKKLEFERLNENKDEVYNVVSNDAYWQMYVTHI
jgi:hypothetical protein